MLDEAVELPTKVLEVMRQPIEDKQVTISRAKGTLTFPASFLLVLAMNPCPQGYSQLENAHVSPRSTVTIPQSHSVRFHQRSA